MERKCLENSGFAKDTGTITNMINRLISNYSIDFKVTNSIEYIIVGWVRFIAEVYNKHRKSLISFELFLG